MSTGWKVEHINDVPPMKETFSKGWKSIRWHMGIEAFGVNGVTKNKGEWLTPVHDEKKDNQDELFIVLSGKVQFHLDYKTVQAGPGTLVSVKPDVRRGALAAANNTTIIIIGAPRKKIYTPASWA